MVTVLVNYYSYVVIQNTAVVQTYPDFPDVTVCNLFPLSDRQNFDFRYRSYLQKLEVLRNYPRSPEKLRNDKDFWYYLRSLIIFNVNVIDHRINEDDNANEQGLIVECNANQWDLYKDLDCPLVVEYDRPLQRCVRIRPNLTDTALVKMLLFIDDFWSDVIDSFYSWTRIPMSTGVRVMVHAHGTKPDTKTSIFVAPGSDLTITVKQTNVTRLTCPRGNCTNQRLMETDGLGSYLYNQATCISLCRQHQVIQACQCIDSFEFFTEAQLQSVNGVFCLNVSQLLGDGPPSNDSVIDHVWDVLGCLWYLVPSEKICDCPVPCSEVNYEVSSSGARWPSSVYQLAFYDRYLRGITQFETKFSPYDTLKTEKSQHDAPDTLRRIRDLKLVEDNFLQVTVKMNYRSVTTITDILAMSWDTMASNLGGSLNLWLGISVLTAAEIIELFYSLIQILWEKTRANDEVARKADQATKPPA